ncbi:MAG: hypothetical protein KA116_03670 [Proteobacteria bacterium]|nr:hypothetical protein [Pseudomonadota bacterium]
MSKKAEQAPKEHAAPKKAPAAQEALGPQKCKFSECKSGPKKFGFCMEHYELYMAGVIRGDGEKPSDFAEKLSLHVSKRKKVA